LRIADETAAHCTMFIEEVLLIESEFLRKNGRLRGSE
jgi:hypothetical protein